MRIEIKAELQKAWCGGRAFTPYRPFYDLHERRGLDKCPCGNPSFAICYCTLMDACSVLCRECLQKHREKTARSPMGL